MKILALDTTAVTAACAVTDGTHPAGVYTQNGTLTHSETMLNMIENLLKNAHLTADEIDLFAVSAGPGSFTGVRIGVSVIKGLAFGKNKPCVPVSALEALAVNLAPLAEIETPFYACPVMDARRKQLYCALFRYDRNADGAVVRTRVREDDMLSSADLEALLAGLDAPVFFVGDGCRVTEREIHLPRAKEAPEALRWQNGYSVALTALETYEKAEDKSVFTDLTLKPAYLRPSQAEREKNGENG